METETAIKPRPRHLTPQMKANVVQAMRPQIEEWLSPEEWGETAEQTLARVIEQHRDGYELARELEYHGWSPDEKLVEILSGVWRTIRSELQSAQKAWAEENNVQPPLPIGSRVTFQRNQTGVIEGIYEHGPAQYLVKEDGCTDTRRAIVNFEDVQALAPAP